MLAAMILKSRWITFHYLRPRRKKLSQPYYMKPSWKALNPTDANNLLLAAEQYNDKHKKGTHCK